VEGTHPRSNPGCGSAGCGTGGISPYLFRAGPGHSRGATMGLRRARRLRGSYGFGDLQKDV